MRILVAMSGGVDSSVVAGLLHERGHEVIGATLQLYDHGAAVSRKGACCAGQDIHDARDVADRLGFAHYVLDRESRFRDAVIGDFADSYARGETPIPCVRCNQTVKFNDLVALARDLGCEAMATGHYARRVDGPHGAELHRAADPARDQSYFLFATTAEQLAFSRFPLGDMPDKAAVRREAVRLGLDVAEKPDSQDICFVPAGRYHETVAKLRPEAAEPGEIVHLDGRVLGRHAGLARYTVGQGRGLGEASRDGGEPLFVAALDAGRRRVVVGPRASVPRAEVVAGDTNWLIAPPEGSFRAEAKFRAREVPQPVSARWDAATGLLHVTPEEPVIAAPGQALVLYHGDRVLGGGFIRRAAARDAVPEGAILAGGVDRGGAAA
ncbi:tRNA 2-thiouridine(34) synthase MnmA [Roseomonas elaeocarpi]|uniref:tRNA-specific 2-thiouridylase MnmA n=1 Tax=Roseomonas elaeocarpi TaxID=907779 RepID=A0ABV6JU45_9PROT